MNRHLQKANGQLNGSTPNAPSAPTAAPLTPSMDSMRSSVGERPAFALVAEDEAKMRDILKNPPAPTGDPVADLDNARAHQYWRDVHRGKVNPYAFDDPWGENGTDSVREAVAGLEGGGVTSLDIRTERGTEAAITIYRTDNGGEVSIQVYGDFLLGNDEMAAHLIWEGHSSPTLEEVAGSYDVEADHLASKERETSR